MRHDPLMAQNPQPHVDTVLVVDDTPESLRFLADTLEVEGIRVLIATSGEAALSLLSHIVPDLILMDAVMPGIGGFEATRILKRDPASARVPVIFMTGLVESEHVLAGLEAGGVDYVRKPLVINELIARVRVHMANARLAPDHQTALDASGRHLVAMGRDEHLLWWTPQAGSLLAQNCPEWSATPGPAPAALRPALAQLAHADESGASVQLDLAHSTLEMVLVARMRGAEWLVRLNDVNPASDMALLQTRHDLTSREAEVLLWISYGKPNCLISEILSISPRMVSRHLEQILVKLGVETRAAAAALAVRAIDD